MRWKQTAWSLVGVGVLAWQLMGCCTYECTPNKQASCACPDGTTVGFQVCGDDGTYGPCTCIPGGTGGSSAGGSSAGGSSTGGSSTGGSSTGGSSTGGSSTGGSSTGGSSTGGSSTGGSGG